MDGWRGSLCVCVCVREAIYIYIYIYAYTHTFPGLWRVWWTVWALLCLDGRQGSANNDSAIFVCVGLHVHICMHVYIQRNTGAVACELCTLAWWSTRPGWAKLIGKVRQTMFGNVRQLNYLNYLNELNYFNSVLLYKGLCFSCCMFRTWDTTISKTSL